MQFQTLTLFISAISAGIAIAAPVQQEARNDLTQRHDDAGWLLATVPEAERNVVKRDDDRVALERILEKKDDDANGIAPKVFIVSMFTPEETVWFDIPEFDILAHNVTIPGLSPLFPQIHCTADYSICQIVTGEGEINAASTITALATSSVFDLRKTYFLIAGIAGISPKVATLGSVTLHRYEVQVALQYEFDPRELPANFSTGYIPFGAYAPNQYPGNFYGTEVFELNAALRDEAIDLIKCSNATLNDTATAAKYRSLYASEPGNLYAAATQTPSVVSCDGATSDVYYSGSILGTAFENFTTLMTNGSGTYCATAQEDNATLEALLRSSSANKTDFSRIIVMRTASDFDRPPPGVSAYENLLGGEQDSTPAFQNLVRAGLPIVTGIVKGWESKFDAGVEAKNYVGDIFGTMGGKMDIGVGSQSTVSKRDVRFGKRNLGAY